MKGLNKCMDCILKITCVDTTVAPYISIDYMPVRPLIRFPVQGKDEIWGVLDRTSIMDVQDQAGTTFSADQVSLGLHSRVTVTFSPAPNFMIHIFPDKNHHNFPANP